MKKSPTDTTAETTRDPNEFLLENGIKRGEETIKKVRLRKPNIEALRGTQLAMLGQLDVDQLIKLLPRISTPALTEHDVLQMEASDLLTAGGIVAGFLFPTVAKTMQSLSE